ncbi:hypothetical protein GOP47_0029376 [Adiantum capillus-veneris]|nr:hypothetical protein GOP47_0029376 [Adiantum capillus-veneris]
MSSKRVTRSSNLSPDFQGLLKNLHGPQQSSNVASDQITLAEASTQDVDKLLGRAGARGASARAKGSAKRNTAKRGRKNAFPEGEESLFYQRNEKCNIRPTENLSMCGASASTLADVKYGSSSRHSVLSQESSETMEHNLPKVTTLGLDLLNDTEDTGLKSDDALIECSSMEDGCEWELGSPDFAGNDQKEETAWDGEINIEMDKSMPTSSEKKEGKRLLRRANAKDKEFAELVHKAHLLCMIARGRLVDAACDDPILQASLLSIVPDHVHFHDIQHVSISELGPFVKWFQSNFQVLSDKSFTSSSGDDLVPHLLDALQKQAGSSEEVVALSVSLLRALGVPARYVTVLDVLPLKPDSSSLEASADWDAFNVDNGSFLQRVLSAKLASSLGHTFSQCAPQTLAMAVTNASASPTIESMSSTRRQSLESRIQKQEITRKTTEMGKQIVEDSHESKSQKKRKKIEFESTNDLQLSTEDDGRDDGANTAKDMCDVPGSEKKKKGDLEFELQLEMAMAATAAMTCRSQGKGTQKSKTKNDLSSSLETKSPANLEKGKGLHEKAARPVVSGSAVWSRKLGPLLTWAEVFCVGKDSGRWVHVDAGRGLLDGAELVEEAARSCRVPLRYVLAFTGNGAKDVTRRYVTLWSAVAPLRVSKDWWNITLAPLKELEAAGTSLDLREEGGADLFQKAVGAGSCGSSFKAGSSSRQSQANNRSSLEDMELDIRACTEPLPKNQQAYKNHHLYALERWLTKYQGLHPRGPILGYCAGHPVFPRACVQDLHTAERWLREGLKVRPHEVPAKIVKNPRSVPHQNVDNSPCGIGDEAPATALFGKWQTEPWHPPAAVDGIVPKNERGNVELWSEKCLPPGTVHISLPRILPVAKKLEIDFAPALVGFEIRNRRSVPVFEGIVVCQEHEAILLEAYVEEEHRRNTEAEKKKEILAVAKWCQLFRSIATRQRLQATYQPCQNGAHRISADDEVSPQTLFVSENKLSNHQDDNHKNHIAHEHFFPEQNQSYDEQSGIRTKICACGFTLKVEEM